jgi:hypothetical protein
MEDKQPKKKNPEKAEKNIRRTITLEPGDYRVVVRYGRQIGLDPRHFSAALRLIIREWNRLARPQPRFKPTAHIIRILKNRGGGRDER